MFTLVKSEGDKIQCVRNASTSTLHVFHEDVAVLTCVLVCDTCLTCQVPHIVHETHALVVSCSVKSYLSHLRHCFVY